ncbi:MAG: N-acetylmuramoyl-L-alanine amidase [Firmicutes bacterium]|nr:N-acetylmuramoyl-L-alanine amidase [Bacillota bacterium]MCM1400616.1 N-acetylmuramoyl-L-alanine amidase [Bacteroides sp.]MCM1477882.1 N-acetylmuramoyl-L-alanine amidase [Bacteroides sp.]
MKRCFRAICLIVLLLCGMALGVAAKNNADAFTVVIDAGHGGHDIGAPGTITNEKSINLAVARKLGSFLEKEKGIRVVYTRNTDKFVTLQGRADIANAEHGNLFVSIHTNSVDTKAKNRSTVRGAAVYTLGLDKTADNLAVAMRENSVMKLENDYTTTYQGFDPTSAESYIIFEMSQNKHLDQSVRAAKAVAANLASTAGRKNNGVRQANFWVLLKTAMPSMLVELDFICNPTEERFMASEAGQAKLAKAIYNGIMEYRNASSVRTDGTAGAKRTSRRNKTEVTDMEKNAAPAIENTDSSPVYKIQFLTSHKTLPNGSRQFLGLSPVEYYTDRGVRKYTYGSYSSPGEAAADLKKVKALFPDAFVIKTVGGVRTP